MWTQQEQAELAVLLQTALVADYRDSRLLSNRAKRAVTYAEKVKTPKAYDLAAKEILRQQDDEEQAVLLALTTL